MSDSVKSPVNVVSALSVLLLLTLLCACTGTSVSTVGGCKSDNDCESGYRCDTDKGKCVENEADGDLESDGDSEIDEDIDLEEWLEKCDPNPPQSEIIIPCKKESCSRVNPPECWSCAWVPDSAQDGNRCYTSGNEKGECSQGECVSESDGDNNGNACDDFNGRCARPGRDCHDDELAAAENYGCEGFCCIPTENVDCINDLGGYCQPVSGEEQSTIECNEGYAASEEPEGCAAFGAWCCEQTGCVKEGKRGNTLDSSDENDVCCNGLDKVGNAEPDDEGQCLSTPDGSFYCVRCGNDTCGPSENICRCEEDCQGTLKCEGNADCPSPSCANLVGGVGCQQTEYSCDDGECVKSEENIENKTCNEDTGMCVDAPATECEENYGYCTGYNQACESGYYVSEQSLGCTGASGRCCLMGQGCYDDGDCADDWCMGFSGLPNCIQYTNTCNVFICEQTEQLYENYFCNENTGKCVNMNDPLCVQNGGYCSTAQQGCSNGYHVADSTAGCTGASARCCLPDNENDCDSSADCDKAYCANTPDGKCIQVTPLCSDGKCEETSEILSNKVCNQSSGLCEAGQAQSCEDLNGECSIIILGCKQGYHVDQSVICGGAPFYACCVKD